MRARCGNFYFTTIHRNSYINFRQNLDPCYVAALTRGTLKTGAHYWHLRPNWIQVTLSWVSTWTSAGLPPHQTFTTKTKSPLWLTGKHSHLKFLKLFLHACRRLYTMVPKTYTQNLYSLGTIGAQ